MQKLTFGFFTRRHGAAAVDGIGVADQQKVENIYDEIGNSPEMRAYNAAKAALESELNFVNQIITGSANGEDPDLIEQRMSCNGSCASCGGCH